jgi:hypothetical protein
MPWRPCTRFEEQSRIVRPHMKELGAYHVGLYQIYHRLMPEKQLPGLRAMADTLEMRCTALVAAEPPRWFKGEAAALKAECAALCEQTVRLKATARETDWAKIDAAVEAVHAVSKGGRAFSRRPRAGAAGRLPAACECLTD